MECVLDTIESTTGLTAGEILDFFNGLSVGGGKGTGESEELIAECPLTRIGRGKLLGSVETSSVTVLSERLAFETTSLVIVAGAEIIATGATEGIDVGIELVLESFSINEVCSESFLFVSSNSSFA